MARGLLLVWFGAGAAALFALGRPGLAAAFIAVTVLGSVVDLTLT